ncbi:hypothetical protein ND748_33420, partial [Frankia sp. AiPs1]|nr:hypothetical protein [Frankia sp. AiPs1]
MVLLAGILAAVPLALYVLYGAFGTGDRAAPPDLGGPILVPTATATASASVTADPTWPAPPLAPLPAPARPRP